MPQTAARNLSERLFFSPAVTAIGKLGAALRGRSRPESLTNFACRERETISPEYFPFQRQAVQLHYRVE
jgi:hypothetical protein